MSTRSHIIVKDEFSAIQLYRHSDGYPNSEHGVLATLPSAFNYAWELPRFEPEDFAAAIIRSWKNNGGNICIDGSAGSDDLFSNCHNDVEYVYVIIPERSKTNSKFFANIDCDRVIVAVYKTYFWDKPCSENATQIGQFTITANGCVALNKKSEKILNGTY